MVLKWGPQLGESWTRYLGFEWKRDEDSCVVRPRSDYVEKLSQDFNMMNCRAVGTPFCGAEVEHVPALALSATEHSRYRRVVGRLLWMAPSRPGIAFAVKELSRACSSPMSRDQMRLKRCLRYLKGSRDFVLRLQVDQQQDQEALRMVQVVVAAAWAPVGDRRSMPGIVVFRQGFPVMFWARTQTTIALSSAEAELLALSAAIADARLVTGILAELNEPVQMQASSDSSAGLAILKRIGPGRVRHLDVRELWLQEEVSSGRLLLQKIPGVANVADLLTKPMARRPFEFLRRRIGVINPLAVEQSEPEDGAYELWTSDLRGRFGFDKGSETEANTRHEGDALLAIKQAAFRKAIESGTDAWLALERVGDGCKTLAKVTVEETSGDFAEQNLVNEFWALGTLIGTRSLMPWWIHRREDFSACTLGL
eukprot:TRINITY_DN92495_c0_g1_i1.p1 TRINITY_DN92495_c0_g1~~TRINITY_DN92495_c0_g1_i1.p1  ORF type:complete len:424 (+),score=77.97 TRINITY_DN92495_c0_g1_i1:193-1464(+)